MPSGSMECHTHTLLFALSESVREPSEVGVLSINFRAHIRLLLIKFGAVVK